MHWRGWPFVSIPRAILMSRQLHRFLLIALLWLTSACGLASASTSGVVISQVYGGNGNAYASDYVELFNAGTAAVNITSWSVQYASASGSGNFASNGVTTLSGTLQPGQYYLVKLTTTSGPALPAADATGTSNLSGTAGKVALVNNSTGLACNGSTGQPCDAGQLAQIVDLVGYGGTANFFEGAAAPAPAAATALLRGMAGCTDTNQNSADFTVGTPAPRNSATPLNPCGGVAGIVPMCPATLSVATGTPFSATLTASDADSIVNNAVFLSGNVAGMSLLSFATAPATGGTASVNFSLSAGVASGNYPVAVRFSNNDSQTATCTINVAVAVPGAWTPIYQIQGSGPTSALTGVRTTRGVVTKVNNNGYYLQDPVGDGDPATSDGIFVFTSNAPSVTPGQLVQITGTVSEFNTGAASNPVTLANTLTEFSNVTSTVLVGTGTITPTPITLPVMTAGDLERYEGMLVQITSPLTASQNYFQGRYGQVTLSAGGRLYKPTNLHRPGTAQALALADQNARSSIMLDDGTSAQNANPTPYIGADNTLRAGDILPTGITGVIDYGLATNDNAGIAMYRIHPTEPPVFTRANPRTATPPAVGGNVKVASFNVLNFFTTFTNGNTADGLTGQGCSLGASVAAANCRGADDLSEFNRQRAKIVAAMAAINADVFGLMEIQNNGNTAAQNLVDALNAAVGAGTYAVVPLPPSTGTDAIRVAMIYKPGTLALAGASLSDADPIHNRPPLARTFSLLANGEKFSVIVNHFKSKGSCPSDNSADEDQGDGQGCWNARRRLQSTALLTFVNTVKSAAGDNDVIVIGDLNAYGKEDPIFDLVTGGLVDQSERFSAAPYSYVFDGEAGHLDHALASASLSAQIASAQHWHINADEPSIIDYNLEFKQPACGTCGPDYYAASPYRASDHDPVLIGINLQPPSAAQVILFDVLANRRLDQSPFTLVASASSGLVVTFSSLTPTVCGVSGTTVSLAAVGICTVAANQAGNAAFTPAPQVTRSFNVTAVGLTQTITFAAIAPQQTGATLTLAPTASSNLPVTISSMTPAICTVSTLTVSVGNVAGTCTLQAAQPGDTAYQPAVSVTQSFSVNAPTGGGDDSGDVPLPAWALALLAAGLARGLVGRRRARAAH